MTVDRSRMSAENTSTPPLRAVIKLTYRCTSRCLFCRVDEHRGRVEDVPLDDVVRKMTEAKKLGVEMVLFSGGEPTIRTDLIQLARAATSLGLRFGLITNGRRLAYEPYRTTLLTLGLAYLHTSLHGATAGTHDHLVQCSGFEHVMDALAGLNGKGVELHVNTVITGTNVHELGALSNGLARFAPITHKLCLMEPRGLFEQHEKEIEINPRDAARAAVTAIRRARTRHPGLITVVEGFPLCQVASERESVSGLREHNIRYMSEGFEDGLALTDHGERTYPALCRQCAARSECPGVYVGYAERYGASGLRALKGSSKNRRGRSPGKRRPRAG